MTYRWLVLVLAAAVGCTSEGSAPPPSGAVATAPLVLKKRNEDRMSAMGRLASRHAQRLQRLHDPLHGGLHPMAADSPGNCGNSPDCADEDSPWIDPDVAIQLGS